MLKSLAMRGISSSWYRTISLYRTVQRKRRKDRQLKLLHEKYNLGEKHISLYRTVQRNRRENGELKLLHEKCKLGEKHTRNLKVLPDREALLDRAPKGGIFAEVGVAEGEFSRMILDRCTPKKLYLIDLWSSESARYGDSKSIAISKVEAELEKGVADIRQGYSWDMIAALPDYSLDWIYIDAAHDYKSVTRDLSAARNKVKENGLICGHDYTRWSGNGLSRWGVVEAVNQFCVNEEWELLYLTNEPHRHLSFAMRRILEAYTEEEAH